MNAILGKKYWLGFAGCYGTLCSIKKIGEEPYGWIQYGFEDCNTGLPYFIKDTNLDKLISDNPSDIDSEILNTISERNKELQEVAKPEEYSQMDFFSLIDD